MVLPGFPEKTEAGVIEQMDKKLIFLDIDGTILVPEEGIRQTVKDGIRKARERGHEIYICTGRSSHMLPEELSDVELDGVIANAGSDIWIHGENVYRTAFDRAHLTAAFEVLDALDTIYILEGYEMIYASERGPGYCRRANRCRGTIRNWPAGKNFSFAGKIPVTSEAGIRTVRRFPRSRL